MATRIYLPSSGSPPITPAAWSTVWEKTTSAAWAPCSTTKSNTALTDFSVAGHTVNPSDSALRGFVTPALSVAHTFGDGTGGPNNTSVTAVIKGWETSLSFNGWVQLVVRVISNDGTTVVGTLNRTSTAVAASATTGNEAQEFPGTTAANEATRIKPAAGGTVVTASVGDRLSIEFGARQASTRTDTFGLRFGDPSATGDFALTADLTTDLCPWVEFSRDLTFSSGATVSTPPDTRRIALRPLLVR